MEDTSEVVESPRKKQPRIITVYGNHKEEVDRVAFYETDEAHPDGEAYVVHDGQPYQVAETKAVKRALGEGRLTTEKVNWNSKINAPRRTREASTLRAATEQEEKAAGLTSRTEKDTAQVPTALPAGIRKGGTPGR